MPATTSDLIRKGKQVVKSDSLDVEFTPGLKRVLIELESVYQRTQIKKRVATLYDDKEDRHSAVMSSFPSNLVKDSVAITDVANLLNEVSKRLKGKKKQ